MTRASNEMVEREPTHHARIRDSRLSTSSTSSSISMSASSAVRCQALTPTPRCSVCSVNFVSGDGACSVPEERSARVVSPSKKSVPGSRSKERREPPFTTAGDASPHIPRWTIRGQHPYRRTGRSLRPRVGKAGQAGGRNAWRGAKPCGMGNCHDEGRDQGI